MDRPTACDRFSLLGSQAFLHAHADGACYSLIVFVEIVGQLVCGTLVPCNFRLQDFGRKGYLAHRLVFIGWGTTQGPLGPGKL